MHLPPMHLTPDAPTATATRPGLSEDERAGGGLVPSNSACAVLSNSATPLATEVVITATAGILELGGSLVRPH